MHRLALSIRSLAISSDATFSGILSIWRLVFIWVVVAWLEMNVVSITEVRQVLVLSNNIATRIKHGTHFSNIVSYAAVGLRDLALQLLILLLDSPDLGLYLADLLVQ